MAEDVDCHLSPRREVLAEGEGGKASVPGAWVWELDRSMSLKVWYGQRARRTVDWYTQVKAEWLCQ